jgi:hypothetical protein
MTFRDEIAALKSRIAQIQSERDTWRASGRQEKYLEAYCTLEALELDLEGLRQRGLNRLRQADLNRLPSAPRIEPDGRPERPGEKERLMAELCIAYNGRHYQYNGYRYDNLADAASHVRLQRALPAGSCVSGPWPLAQDVPVPDQADREVMAALAITFRDGVYHLGPYRYDRLADAVRYARLRRTHAR